MITRSTFRTWVLDRVKTTYFVKP